MADAITRRVTYVDALLTIVKNYTYHMSAFMAVIPVAADNWPTGWTRPFPCGCGV